jgi:hypothetical protein
MRYDVAGMERNSGPEFVRLFAAHVADRKLMAAGGLLAPGTAIVLAIILFPGAWVPLGTAAGILGIDFAIGAVSFIRFNQCLDARREYRQAAGLPPMDF